MDAVILIAAFLAMIVPWVIAGLWWWVGFWLVIASALAIAEALSFFITGKTLSQKFWAWKDDELTKAWKKWLILAGMLVFWTYLILHLYLKL